MSTTTQYHYLAPNPKSSYRQLFVKGTRIRARVLYGWHANSEPMSAEEIAADYKLPVEAVKEAIAYCESNPPELLQDYAREEALMEASGMNDPDYKLHGTPKALSPEERERIKRRFQ
ncbi:MAG: DUF433 domain-containing protein [Planctomycetaceae bacterium]